jgi:dihydrofolate reductase / thymidylate synthase
MEHFKSVTTSMGIDDSSSLGTNGNRMINAVIMGRATWESIPPRFRPLAGRLNVVLSRNPEYKVAEQDAGGSVLTATSLPNALQKLEKHKDDTTNDKQEVATIFVIGGANVYEQALKGGYVTRVLYTEVDNIPESTKFDVFFPELSPEQGWTCRPFSAYDKENGGGVVAPSLKKLKTGEQRDYDEEYHVDTKSGLTYRFLEYIRIQPEPTSSTTATTTTTSGSAATAPEEPPHEELQYLNLCREIITSGVKRGDRTGTGTLSRFGTQMRFSLRNGRLPLLTTKRTFWRGVAEELLWFVSVRVVYTTVYIVHTKHCDGYHKRNIRLFQHSGIINSYVHSFCHNSFTA